MSRYLQLTDEEVAKNERMKREEYTGKYELGLSEYLAYSFL